MSDIPDPTELLNSRIERHTDNYVDENTCMECGKKVDYELICPDPLGSGPAVCIECFGYDPFEDEIFNT